MDMVPPEDTGVQSRRIAPHGQDRLVLRPEVKPETCQKTTKYAKRRSVTLRHSEKDRHFRVAPSSVAASIYRRRRIHFPLPDQGLSTGFTGEDDDRATGLAFLNSVDSVRVAACGRAYRPPAISIGRAGFRVRTPCGACPSSGMNHGIDSHSATNRLSDGRGRRRSSR